MRKKARIFKSETGISWSGTVEQKKRAGRVNAPVCPALSSAQIVDGCAEVDVQYVAIRGVQGRYRTHAGSIGIR